MFNTETGDSFVADMLVDVSREFRVLTQAQSLKIASGPTLIERQSMEFVRGRI